MMAFRMKSMMQAQGHWRSMATSTPAKLKAYAAPAEVGGGRGYKQQQQAIKGDLVPVCVAIGMIALSVTFGVHTAKQQLMYGPNVFVKKKRRETLPEVVEPEHVLEDADRYVTKSFFRKVGHVQDPHMNYAIKDSTRGDAYASAHRPRADTLKSVGVDPLPAHH